MKIVHVVEPFSSGITTFIIHLTRELPSHEHDVIHGSRSTVDEIEKVKKRFPQAVKFHLWKSAVREISLVKDFKAFIELWRIINRLNPDIIHLHSSKAGVIGRCVGLFFRKDKFIYTPNGAAFLRQDVSSLKRKMFAFIEWFASKLSGRVVCCSKSEANAYDRISVRCTYINNGTNLTQTEKKKNKKLKIGCVALITAQKDPASFNTIAQYFQNDDDIEFYWVGDGEDKNLLTSSNVVITGWLNEQQVKEMYESLDIYLSCSKWEGLPFSVLEAMNAKICLLLSNCVGNVDLVENEINGYLYNNIDEAISRIIELKNNRFKLIEMGNKSRDLLSKSFSARECALLYEKKYYESVKQVEN